jgi:arylamine N-acetyltransferase
MIILVTIQGTRYLIDVGVGTTGSVFPIPVLHDQVSSNIEPQQIRLVYESIPDATDSNLKWWIYQHRHAPDKPWIPTYCFQEIE